jgi:hypothetical protein
MVAVGVYQCYANGSFNQGGFMSGKAEKKGFRVGLAERRVELEVDQDGRQHLLVHVLRQPTTDDWIEFDKNSSEYKLKGRKSRFETKVLKARVVLYNKLIKSVEGYWDEELDKPLTTEIPDWKEKIPALHKSEIINEFGEVSVVEGEGEKN